MVTIAIVFRVVHWNEMGFQKKKEESLWPSKCQKFEVIDSLARGRPRKIWIKVMQINLEEWKVR